MKGWATHTMKFIPHRSKVSCSARFQLQSRGCWCRTQLPSAAHTSTSGYLKTHACRQTCMVDVPAYIYIYTHLQNDMQWRFWHGMTLTHFILLCFFTLREHAHTPMATLHARTCTYIDTDNFKAYTYIRYVAPPGTFKTHMPPHAKQTPTEIYANLSQTHEQTAMRLCEEHLRTSLVSIRSSKLSRATETFGSPGAHGLLPEAQRSTLSVLVGRSCSGLGGGGEG